MADTRLARWEPVALCDACRPRRPAQCRQRRSQPRTSPPRRALRPVFALLPPAARSGARRDTHPHAADGNVPTGPALPGVAPRNRRAFGTRCALPHPLGRVPANGEVRPGDRPPGQARQLADNAPHPTVKEQSGPVGRNGFDLRGLRRPGPYAVVSTRNPTSRPPRYCLLCGCRPRNRQHSPTSGATDRIRSLRRAGSRAENPAPPPVSPRPRPGRQPCRLGAVRRQYRHTPGVNGTPSRRCPRMPAEDQSITGTADVLTCRSRRTVGPGGDAARPGCRGGLAEDCQL